MKDICKILSFHHMLCMVKLKVSPHATTFFVLESDIIVKVQISVCYAKLLTTSKAETRLTCKYFPLVIDPPHARSTGHTAAEIIFFCNSL